VNPDLSIHQDRWGALGPYYAMFPLDFAVATIRDYSSPGEGILDPFCGRGSTVYAASVLGRRSYGIEISPVGWLYSSVKLRPAPQDSVLLRLREIGDEAAKHKGLADSLPTFFQHCFSRKVLSFLAEARQSLQWRINRVDATLMAVLLVYLHGKRSASLSNQMRQSRAMSPQYSVRWWKRKKLEPPQIDPFSFLDTRIRWRYRKGNPRLKGGRVLFGDSEVVLPRLRPAKPFSLLFTSPPYCDVANYHYDQWLRLWMLGGPPHPKYSFGEHKSKFASLVKYRSLLENVFRFSATHLTRNAVVYVRTDARERTYQCTRDALAKAFRGRRIVEISRPFVRPTQTALFGDKRRKPGEIDLIIV
jgi:hypothetical protein